MADPVVTPASVLLVSGTSAKAIAGETITAGQTLYIKSSDKKVYKADADSATAEVRKCAGIALNGGAAGQPIVYALPGSVVNMGATLAVGVTYLLSDTPGGFMPSADAEAGDYIVVVGVALTAANLKFQVIDSATAFV